VIRQAWPALIACFIFPISNHGIHIGATLKVLALISVTICQHYFRFFHPPPQPSPTIPGSSLPWERVCTASIQASGSGLVPQVGGIWG
jgi:hypothetical protein